MEERVTEILKQAGINAPPEIIKEFCQSLEESQDINVKKENKKLKSTKKAKGKKKSTKLGPSSSLPNEMEMWEEKMAIWEKKVEALDRQLQECSDIHSSYSSSFIGNQYQEKNDPLSVYPVLKEGPHGFIHPPNCMKPIRKRFPIYQSEKFSLAPNFVSELRERERREHPYIPGNENRQDALRWRIKERLIYSHPDYYLREQRK